VQSNTSRQHSLPHRTTKKLTNTNTKTDEHEKPEKLSWKWSAPIHTEMLLHLRVMVSDFGHVGSGHGSVCHTRCLTRFWVLTCAFIVALFLQSNTISAN